MSYKGIYLVFYVKSSRSMIFFTSSVHAIKSIRRYISKDCNKGKLVLQLIFQYGDPSRENGKLKHTWNPVYFPESSRGSLRNIFKLWIANVSIFIFNLRLLRCINNEYLQKCWKIKVNFFIKSFCYRYKLISAI